MYSVCTRLTQPYLLVECKVQLHVSALDNGHLKHEYTHSTLVIS